MDEQERKDKKLEKLQKAIGKEKMDTMDAMSTAELERVIIDSQKNMADAVTELQGNQKYIDAKNVVKTLEGGLRDVRKINTAQIDYAIIRLEEKGKM